MGTVVRKRDPRTLLAPADAAGKLLHLVLSMILILSLSYALGYVLLEDPLKGGDRSLHVAYIEWLNTYFPEIPHWFPQQGGGVSLLHGYPLLSYLLVIILHRFTEFSLLQSGSILSFAAFPVAAIAIYIFCWSALRNQTVGLVAAVFYLLAPLTWTWIYDWGFFPYSLSLIFLPFTLIFFDRYLSLMQRDPRSGRRRLWLIGVVVSIALAAMTHPAAGASGVAAILLYSVFAALTAKPGERFEIVRHSVKAILFSGFLVLLLLAFYLLPFYKYSQIANREGLNLLALDQIPHIPRAEFFGLSPIDPKIIHTRISNPLVATLFLLIGLPLSARTSRKAFALMLAALLAAIYSLFPEFAYGLSKISSSLAMVFGLRSTLGVVMVLFPIGAAYGAWAIVRAVISPSTFFRREESTGTEANVLQIGLRRSIVSSGALILVAVAAVQIGLLKGLMPYHVSYGPSPNGIDLRGIWGQRSGDPCESQDQGPWLNNLCSLPEARAKLNIQEFIMECDRVRAVGLEEPSLCKNPSPNAAAIAEFIAECEVAESVSDSLSPCDARVESLFEQLAIENWPAILLVDTNLRFESAASLASLLPEEDSLRIDISPYLGRLAQYFTVFSGTSQIQAYTNQLSLIHATWGYQLGVFYSEEYGSPEALNDLADWLGIRYVFIDPGLDPIEKYETAGWDPISNEAGDQVMWNPRAPEMATASTRPTILIIGGQDNGSYNQLFRLANEGLAPYSQFTIVEGIDRIDRYSLDELRRFDILFLHGYDYKNSSRAWSLLNDYVSQGGSLFVDTGWQFEVPEWEFEQAPQVLPVGELSWTNSGQVSNYSLENTEIAGDVDTARFDPMVWEDQAWSFSGADRTSLREWGRPILSVRGRPLIVAGELGQGRVVWSGMNFVAHLVAYENEEEQRLLNNLLRWLGRGQDEGDLETVEVIRNHPDRVDFSVATAADDVTWLYWREAYYPNWQAYVEDGTGNHEIPIYRAGPGFMLMPIETPSGNVSVKLVWELSVFEQAAILASALGFLFVGALLLDGTLLGGNGFTWLKIAIVLRVPSPFLGKGASHEWAERKRTEIASGRLTSEPRIYEPGGAVARPGGSGTATPPGPSLDGNGHLDDVDLLVESLPSEEGVSLLQTWLESSGNKDDAWAEKLIRRRGPAGEA